MRLHVLRRRLRVLWRRRPLRVAAVVLGLAAVVALDVYLIAPRLEPRIDGAPPDRQPVHPGETLRLVEVLPPGGRLALDAERAYRVELWVSAARLAPELRADWARMGMPLPPDGAREVKYTFGHPSEEPVEPPACRSALDVAPVVAGGSRLSLRLDQSVDHVSSRHGFPLRLTPIGGGLRVQVDDFPDPEASPGARCRRLLRIGEDELYDPSQLVLSVPADAVVELAFWPAAAEVDAVEPFDLAARPGDVAPDAALAGRHLEIRSPASVALSVRGAGETASIRVGGLRLARDRLEITYSGEGHARGPRAPAGTKPFARLRHGLLAYPLWVLALGAIHLALLQALRAALAGGEKTP